MDPSPGICYAMWQAAASVPEDKWQDFWDNRMLPHYNRHSDPQLAYKTCACRQAAETHAKAIGMPMKSAFETKK
jgi:hypothetical protein